jgi:DNA-binding MarR family transcriptional regulator
MPKVNSSQHLAQLIARFSEAIHRRSSRESISVMHQSGLTMPQLIVLYILIRAGMQSVSSLSGKIRLSLAATSQLVDRLVRTGLVTRTEGKTDRRVRIVKITVRGRQLVAKLERVRSEELAEGIGALPEALQQNLTHAMEAVVTALERLLPASGPREE